MIRSCISWCRHLLYALAMLALLGCLTEIGLRVYDSATGQVTRPDLYDKGLVCKSWSVHHHLKPSHNFAVRHPDRDERIRVELNSLGLRGKEVAIPRPQGTYRIICLGDETTLASQTPEEETYCARLRQSFHPRDARQVEVLNAGVPEYCPLLSYLQFKQQLLGLQPDLVIIHVAMDDISDDYRYRRLAVMQGGGLPVSCAHPGLEMPAAGRKSKGNRADDLFLLPVWCRQKLTRFWANQSLGDSARSIDSPQGKYLWLEDHPPDWSTHIEHALAPLVHLRDLVESLPAELVVVVSPAPWQVSSKASSGEGVREQLGLSRDEHFRSTRPFEIVAEFCRVQGLACCDLAPAFRRAAQPERLYLEHAAALSPEGHALFAQELGHFLENSLGQPSPAGQPTGSRREELIDLPQARLPRR
ncbi:MAG: hypothetical protein ACKV0T_18850 [Planctomycetales bacterium]